MALNVRTLYDVKSMIPHSNGSRTVNLEINTEVLCHMLVVKRFTGHRSLKEISIRPISSTFKQSSIPG